MQWDDGSAGGFSTAAVYLLVRPAISRGHLGARKVNVRTQQRDPHSLLAGSTR
jgi:maltose alpha-D-glucosyltransferase / alpha-amylase